MYINAGDGQQRETAVGHVLTDWWQQVRLRHELEGLDDNLLRDIGLTRGNERSKASMPFLMN